MDSSDMQLVGVQRPGSIESESRYPKRGRRIESEKCIYLITCCYSITKECNSVLASWMRAAKDGERHKALLSPHAALGWMAEEEEEEGDRTTR